MTIDPRTPVLVAVGEVTNRSATVIDPIDLAAEAAHRALADAGAAVVHRIDTVATPGILMMGRDHPASRIADAVGLRARRRISCPVGGNTPQYLVEVLGRDIMNGHVDVALIVGAEAGDSARRARASGGIPAAQLLEGRDELHYVEIANTCTYPEVASPAQPVEIVGRQFVGAELRGVEVDCPDLRQ